MLDLSKYNAWYDYEKYEILVLKNGKDMGILNKSILWPSPGLSNRNNLQDAMKELKSSKAKSLLKEGYDLHLVKVSVKHTIVA